MWLGGDNCFSVRARVPEHLLAALSFNVAAVRELTSGLHTRYQYPLRTPCRAQHARKTTPMNVTPSTTVNPTFKACTNGAPHRTTSLRSFRRLHKHLMDVTKFRTLIQYNYVVERRTVCCLSTNHIERIRNKILPKGTRTHPCCISRIDVTLIPGVTSPPAGPPRATSTPAAPARTLGCSTVNSCPDSCTQLCSNLHRPRYDRPIRGRTRDCGDR